jgi:hypothetical protein
MLVHINVLMLLEADSYTSLGGHVAIQFTKVSPLGYSLTLLGVIFSRSRTGSKMPVRKPTMHLIRTVLLFSIVQCRGTGSRSSVYYLQPTVL